MYRLAALIILALSCIVGGCACAEEAAAELEAHGVEALKLSQTTPDAVVSAALFFGKAQNAYETAGDDGKATEMNSFLYWCKKKMTLEQMNAFLKEHQTSSPDLIKRLKAQEKEAVSADDAKACFNRAEKYAQAHPDEHYLIAVRYFEVADRFRGTEVSLNAQDRSLQAQQLALADLNKKLQAPRTQPSPGAAPVTPATSSSVALPAAATKALPPGAAALKAAEKEVKDAFKASYARTTQNDRLALARELLLKGRALDGDPNGKYAMLNQSKDLAVLAGDATVSLQAIDAIDAAFTVDTVPMRVDALARVAATASTPELRVNVAKAYVAEIDALQGAQKYDAAMTLFTPTDAAIRRVSDAPTLAALSAQLKSAREHHAEYLKVSEALELIKTNVDDGDANAVAGKYHCVVSNDWAKGLPMLQKGSDAVLKEAAAADLGATASGEAKIKAGDLWLGVAEKETHKPSQLAMQNRARQMYEGAILAQIHGLILAKAWSKLKSLQTTSGADPSKQESRRTLDRSFTDKLLVVSKGFKNTATYADKRVVESNGKPVEVIEEGPMKLAVELWGKKRVFCIHPPGGKATNNLEFTAITANTEGLLTISFRNFPTGDCEVDIEVDGKVTKTLTVGGNVWKTEKISFQRQPVRILNRATGWWNEHAFITYDIELK